MKAIVLAAGLGTRLRPVTDFIPKPLVPILNQPLLDIALKQLQSAGFHSFAVNAFHLADAVVEFGEKRRSLGLDLTVMRETPEILGTGGPLSALSGWIGKSSFVVYNGDILSEIDFSALSKAHQASPKNLVTMAVRPGHNGHDRAVWVKRSGDGRLQVFAISKAKPDIPDVAPYTFACAYVADATLLHLIPNQGPSDIIDAFSAALKQSSFIEALVFDGYWADVGTPQSLWDTTKEIHTLPTSKRDKILCLEPGSDPLTAQSAQVNGLVKKSGLVVIGEGAVIEANCDLRNCIVLPATHLPRGTKAEQVILGPNGCQVPVR